MFYHKIFKKEPILERDHCNVHHKRKENTSMTWHTLQHYYKAIARKNKIKYRVWRRHDMRLISCKDKNYDKIYTFFNKYAKKHNLDTLYPLTLQKKKIGRKP